MKLIIVENLQKLKMLFNVDCSTVKQVVLMNSKPDEEIPTKEGVSVITWAEALKAGEEGSLNEARPTPDSLGEYKECISSVKCTTILTSVPSHELLWYKLYRTIIILTRANVAKRVRSVTRGVV